MSANGRRNSPVLAENDEWEACVVQVGEVVEKLCDVADDFSAEIAARLTQRPSATWQAAFRKVNPPGAFKAVQFLVTDTMSYAVLTVPARTTEAIVKTYRKFCHAVELTNVEFAEQRKHRHVVLEAIHGAIEEINQ